MEGIDGTVPFPRLAPGTTPLRTAHCSVADERDADVDTAVEHVQLPRETERDVGALVEKDIKVAAIDVHVAGLHLLPRQLPRGLPVTTFAASGI